MYPGRDQLNDCISSEWQCHTTDKVILSVVTLCFLIYKIILSEMSDKVTTDKVILSVVTFCFPFYKIILSVMSDNVTTDKVILSVVTLWFICFDYSKNTEWL